MEALGRGALRSVVRVLWHLVWAVPRGLGALGGSGPVRAIQPPHLRLAAPRSEVQQAQRHMTAGELGLDPSSPTGVWMQFLIDSYDNGGPHPRRGRAGRAPPLPRRADRAGGPGGRTGLAATAPTPPPRAGLLLLHPVTNKDNTGSSQGLRRRGVGRPWLTTPLVVDETRSSRINLAKNEKKTKNAKKNGTKKNARTEQNQ